jgi:hypothetical protein
MELKESFVPLNFFHRYIDINMYSRHQINISGDFFITFVTHSFVGGRDAKAALMRAAGKRSILEVCSVTKLRTDPFVRFFWK